MIKKIISVFLFSGLLISLCASAQPLTLDECVEMALENNARMRTAKYNLMASHETSREMFTKYFP